MFIGQNDKPLDFSSFFGLIFICLKTCQHCSLTTRASRSFFSILVRLLKHWNNKQHCWRASRIGSPKAQKYIFNTLHQYPMFNLVNVQLNIKSEWELIVMAANIKYPFFWLVWTIKRLFYWLTSLLVVLFLFCFAAGIFIQFRIYSPLFNVK